MDLTMHWSKHNDQIEFTAGCKILEFQQFSMQGLTND